MLQAGDLLSIDMEHEYFRVLFCIPQDAGTFPSNGLYHDSIQTQCHSKDQCDISICNLGVDDLPMLQAGDILVIVGEHEYCHASFCMPQEVCIFYPTISPLQLPLKTNGLKKISSPF